MKTNAKQLMMVVAAAALTACSSNTDLYDTNVINEGKQVSVKESYVENFAKKYPNVDLNQNWDFSTKQSDYRMGSNNMARTRANDGGITAGSWYEVDNNTLAWMHEQLVTSPLSPSIRVRQEPCGISTSWWMASITWCGRRSTRPVWVVLTKMFRMKQRQVPSRSKIWTMKSGTTCMVSGMTGAMDIGTVSIIQTVQTAGLPTGAKRTR